MDKKRVYTFGNGKAEGKADMRNLLGGKGANLAEMNLIGVPVPPGFTITTEVCTEYYEMGRDKVVALLKDEVESAIAHVETLMRSKFGDVENPLLVSVRSGARASMPGMMDTILNLGLNDDVVEGLTRKTGLTLETLSGIKRLHLHTRAACGQEVVEQVTVDMGVPRLLHESLTLEANDKQFTGTAVDMGNPHFVVFADGLDSIDLAKDGRALEHHPAFPDRSNIEFVHVANRHEAEMHVWERGSGITQACGTGACASQVAAFHAGLTDREATVHMPGGDLTIRLDESTGHVLMTGGAETVFEGEIQPPTP